MDADLKEIIDLLVIGLGPAGARCAVNAKREGLAVRAISDEPIGGLVRSARRLDNLLENSGISGEQLALSLERSLKREKVPFRFGKVVEIEKLNEKNGGFFKSTINNNTQILSRTICLCAGTVPAKWEFETGLPNSMIHRDIRTIRKNISGARVLVIGNGDSAFDTALSLHDCGAKPTIISRSNIIKANDRLIAETIEKKIPIEMNISLKTVILRDSAIFCTAYSGKKFEADFVVACIGREPRCDLIEKINPNWQKKIVQDNVHGLFLAGDLIRDTPERYATLAMSDGENAVRFVIKYLNNNEHR